MSIQISKFLIMGCLFLSILNCHWLLYLYLHRYLKSTIEYVLVWIMKVATACIQLFLMHQRNIKRKRNNNDKKRQKIIFIFFNVIERFTNSNSSTLARVNLNLPKQCMFTPLTVKMNRNEESHPQWIKSSLDYIFIHILGLVKW